MCNCRRAQLDELNVDYKYAFPFDNCLWNTEHKLFAIKCTKCCFNVVGFARNYFASVICLYYQTHQNFVYSHCKQIVHTLNLSMLKFCIEAKKLPKEFDLMEINNYLQKCLKTEPFFFTQKKIINFNCLLMHLIGEPFL